MNEQELEEIIKKNFYPNLEEVNFILKELTVPYLIKTNETVLDREISEPKLFFDLFD